MSSKNARVFANNVVTIYNSCVGTLWTLIRDFHDVFRYGYFLNSPIKRRNSIRSPEYVRYSDSVRILRTICRRVIATT